MKILDLSEKGVIQSLRSAWWSGSNECEATSSVTANDMEAAAALDLPHLGKIFCISWCRIELLKSRLFDKF